MQSEINGWSVIKRLLERRNYRQKDIADLLNISSPAVTQAKYGAIAFDSLQLAAIIAWLDMDEEETLEFYTSIFNARIIEPARIPGTMGERRFQLVSIGGQPGKRRDSEVSAALLCGYNPAFETMGNFLLRHGVVFGDTLNVFIPPEMRREEDFKSVRCVEIEPDEYPEPDTPVLMLTDSGKMHLCYWTCRNGENLFLPLSGSKGAALTAKPLWLRQATVFYDFKTPSA